jgi:peptidoglycan/LPS O-acetylase OafA/YrhL
MRIELAQRLSKTHIPALDGIRGISAFLVFCAHAGLLPRQYGALGVAIFFVLSGFLITWLLLKENAATGTVSLKAFYIRRTLRIFPAFYVFWFLCMATALLTGAAVNRAEVLSSFFYVGDYYNGLKQILPAGPTGIMGITWSLGVEEKFYLIWPWVFIRYRNDLPKLLKLVAGGMCLVWAYRISICLLGISPVDYLRYAFESRVDNIMYGCLLAIVVKTGRFQKPLSRVTNAPLLPVLLAAALAGSVWLEDSAGPTFHYLGGMTIDAILITLLLAQFITLSGTRLWSWLEAPPLRFAGRISYSVYLYHFTVIMQVRHLLGSSRWSVQLITAFCVTLALATLSYKLVERPFLRLKDRFASETPTTSIALSANA